MKIEFTGAGCTGKTTTAKLLAEKLDIPFFPSVSREVFKLHGKTEQDIPDMSVEELHKLQMEIFEVDLKKRHELKDFVADRSLVCRVAYNLHKGWQGIGTPDLIYMMEAAARTARQSDLVVYFPPRHWDEKDDDGFRLKNPTADFCTDVMIRGLLQTMQVPVTTTPPVDARTRADFLAMGLRVRQHAAEQSKEAGNLILG